LKNTNDIHKSAYFQTADLLLHLYAAEVLIMKYDVFISHASQDSQDAQLLRDSLERRQIACWMAERDILFGTEWPKKVWNALTDSKLVVLVVTSAATESPWVWREICLAVDRRIPLFPVRVEFSALSGALHYGISGIQWFDCGTGGLQPHLNAICDQIESFLTGPLEPFHRTLRPWNMPTFRNPQFIGRSALLAEIRDRLATTNTATFSAPQVFVGLGGVGKTQLAIEYVYRYGNHYNLIWWVRAATPVTLMEDFAELAIVLGIVLPTEGLNRHKNREETVRRVIWYLGTQRNYLLIFDNAPNPSAILHHLPRPLQGHIVITSRSPTWRQVAHPVNVPVLGREDSVQLLVQNTTPSDDEGANILSEVLGDLPLALVQAAAYMEQHGISCTDYLHRLNHYRVRLLEKGPLPLNYNDTVAGTWRTAFEQIRIERPSTARLLHLCSLMEASHIPILFLVQNSQPDSAPTSPLELDEDVALLLRYSLVERESRFLSIHRLVQLITRDHLASMNQLKPMCQTALEIMKSAFQFDADDVATWPPCTELLPHVLAVCEHARRMKIETEVVGDLYYLAASFLDSRGALLEARRLHTIALEIRQSLFKSEEHESVVQSLYGLAEVLVLLEDNQEAKKLQKRILSIRQKQHNNLPHVEVAEALQTLGSTYWYSGDLSKAIEKLRKAISILEKCATDNTETVLAAAMHHLAMVLLDKAEFEESEELLLRVLQLHRKTFGEKPHPDVAATKHELARVKLAKLEKIARAEQPDAFVPVIPGNDLRPIQQLLNESLEIQLQIGREKHTNALQSLHVLARVFLLQRKFDEATSNLEKKISVQREIYGSDCHSSIAESLHERAVIHIESEEFSMAISLLEQVLSIEEIVYGTRDHHSVATTEATLGIAFYKAGQNEKGHALLDHALTTLEDKLGPRHPRTVSIRSRRKALSR
jgi:tetratricopeptide (TPR) repeat protein